MKPGHVDLDAADNLIAAAAILVGDDAPGVLALLMISVATVILDANGDNLPKAVAAARSAGAPLTEAVETLAAIRLAESRGGGHA